jgi:hypothetical protein
LHKEFTTSLRPGVFTSFFYQGTKMDTVTNISAEAVPAPSNLFITAMAVVCGLAAVVTACLAANGLDISAGLF